MDEVILKNLKGTGNMELHLSRKIAENVFPEQSTSTVQVRVKKTYFTTPDELQKCGFFAKSQPNGRSGSDGIPHRQTYGGETNDEFLKL